MTRIGESIAQGEARPDANGETPFEAFYRAEFPRMVDIAYALSGSRTAAEDLAQEAMFVAHRQWDRVSRLDRPGAWVRRVVINRSASLYHRTRAEFKALVRLGLPTVHLAPLDGESDHVWGEVRRLPRRQAQAIALHYLDDLPVAEVAVVMECSVGTVKALLHQGRSRLQERLIEGGAT